MRLSVVIPCFNRASTIGGAIQSALAQTVPPDEIIVVDDGSRDGSAEAALAAGPIVRVIRQANAGAAAARNRGIEVARGEWIAFLDSDDHWHPDKIALQLDAARQFPDAGLIFCDTETVQGNTRLMESRFALGGLYGAETERRGLFARYDRALFSRMLDQARVITSAVMVRRSLPDLKFPEDIWGSEDWALWLVLALHHPFASVDRVLVTMHQQGDNVSGRKGRIYRNDVKVLESLARRRELTGAEQDLVARELSTRRIGALYHSLIRGELREAAAELDKVPRADLGWTRYQLYRFLCRCPPGLVRTLGQLRHRTDSA